MSFIRRDDHLISIGFRSRDHIIDIRICFPIPPYCWDGVAAEICEMSVKTVYDAPGSDVKKILELAAEANVQNIDSQLVNDYPGWCKKKGKNWHAEFFDKAVLCAWTSEDICRDEYCLWTDGGTDSDIPGIKIDTLPSCLTNCVDYALTRSGRTKEH